MKESTPTVSARPRAGRRFRPTHERELMQPAIQACHSLWGATENLILLEELSGPIGVPDITAVVGDSCRLDARLELAVPPLLNEIDASVTAIAHPYTARSTALFARRLDWPTGTVARRIPRLLRVGALREIRPDVYVRPTGLEPIGRIYAIEMKVDGWTSGLRQARAYSTWADSYILVMGRVSSRALDKLTAEVRRDGGGLVVGERWICRPHLRRHTKPRRLWASEHVVAAVHRSVHH